MIPMIREPIPHALNTPLMLWLPKSESFIEVDSTSSMKSHTEMASSKMDPRQLPSMRRCSFLTPLSVSGPWLTESVNRAILQVIVGVCDDIQKQLCRVWYYPLLMQFNEGMLGANSNKAKPLRLALGPKHIHTLLHRHLASAVRS